MHTLHFKRRDEDHWSLTLKLQGGTYEESSDEEDKLNFGMYLWPSATLLSRFILDAPHVITGKRVIELGAGTGLSGIVAAGLCSPTCVTLTDIPGHVLANLQMNVHANLNVLSNVSVAVKELLWESAPKEIMDAPEAWGFDVVLAADCLYAESHIGDFFATLASLAFLNPLLVCYLVYQERCTNTCVKPHLDFWGLKAEYVQVQDLISLPLDIFDDQEINPAASLRLIKITLK